MNDPIFQRLQEVRSTLNRMLYERQQEIDGVLIAVLASTSAFFYGDPGTAKSHLIDSACTLLGLTNFDILLSETTKPDQIFGPIDVPQLAQGRQVHKTKGYAPQAEVLFFDEIFKANSTVLNPLLQLINEHKFRDGDNGMVPCPVRTTFAASNEIPTDTVLRAIYDRLILRYHVRYMQDDDSIRATVRQSLGNRDRLSPILDSEQVEYLRGQVDLVAIPDDVLDTAMRLRRQVEEVVGPISDRRFIRSIKVVKAAAYLRGGNTVQVGDLEVLSHVFWQQEDQIERVQQIVWANTCGDVALLSTYVEESSRIEGMMYEGGNLRSRYAALRALYREVKKYNSSYARQVAARIKQAGSRYRELMEKRKTIELYRVIVDGLTIYKLSTASEMCWTTKELSQMGFRYRRKAKYRYLTALGPLKQRAKEAGITLKIIK